MKYTVAAGTLTVKARSRVHDTTTVWSKLTGEVEADADTLATAGAKAIFHVDMTTFDAGDWLKNRKLRKDFDLDHHPTATFELRSISEVVRDGPSFSAKAEGVLKWRGKEVVVVLAGQGKLDGVGVAATGSFELDIKRLGLAAPKFLMFKVEDEVTVDVTIQGLVRA